MKCVNNQTWNQAWDLVHDQVWRQVWIRVYDQVRNQYLQDANNPGKMPIS